LASREFELGTTQRLNSGVLQTDEGADGHHDLADGDAGQQAVGLAEGSTHTGLQTIGAGAGQHFVDAENVVGVEPSASPTACWPVSPSARS